MATENLQIPDIAAAQNQKEVTANAAHNLLDRALNKNVTKAIAGDTTFTTTETRENFLIELTGTPGAPHTIDMPDTNKRTLAVVNNTDGVMTIRNSAGAGTGQPVLAVGTASIFHYDGVNFIDITDLLGAVSTFIGGTDTPSAFTGESGTFLTVNNAENALVFLGTNFKQPVVVATTAAQVLADDFENGDTIDGITLVTGDRILIKDQATAADNGIYIVQASGAPTRADDFDDDKDAVLGCIVPVNEGTANKQTFFQLSNITAVTIGATNQTWLSAGGGGGGGTFIGLSDTPGAITAQKMLVGDADGGDLEEFDIAYDIASTVAGVPATNSAVLRYMVPRNFRLPTDLTNSQGRVGSAPSSAIVFDIQQGGSSIGSMNFAMSATTATFTFASDVDFVAGDRLEVVSPANLQGAADLSLTLSGIRRPAT